MRHIIFLGFGHSFFVVHNGWYSKVNYWILFYMTWMINIYICANLINHRSPHWTPFTQPEYKSRLSQIRHSMLQRPPQTILKIWTFGTLQNILAREDGILMERGWDENVGDYNKASSKRILLLQCFQTVKAYPLLEAVVSVKVQIVFYCLLLWMTLLHLSCQSLLLF